MEKRTRPPLSKKSGLGTSFQKRLRKVSTIVGLDPTALDAEVIHQLRTEIKKLKALFSIAAIKGKFKENHYFKPLKKLFDQAGNIRTNYIELQLMDKYQLRAKGSLYIKKLEKSQAEECKKLVNLFKDNPIDTRRLERIVVLLKKVSREEIKEHLDTEAKKLKREIKKMAGLEEELHVLRKDLKGFYLNAKIIVSKSKVKQLKMLLECMGEWHDRKVTFNHIVETALSMHGKATELNRLDKVKSRLLNEKRKFFDEIVSVCVFSNKTIIPRSF